MRQFEQARFSVESIKSLNHVARSFDPDRRVDVASALNKKTETYDPDKRISDSGSVSTEDGTRSKTETIDSIRVYRDDDEKIYRIGDKLLPNAECVVKGYRFVTDSEGRITIAEGQLRMADGKRRDIKESAEQIGRGYQKDADDRGHLIAARFDGPGGLLNIVSMDYRLNRGDYKKMENRLSDALKDGREVYFKVEPRYIRGSFRPNSFIATYTINGEKTVEFLKNKGANTNA